MTLRACVLDAQSLQRYDGTSPRPNVTADAGTGAAGRRTSEDNWGYVMAHSKSALKRWRQNEAHRERNKPVRTAARTAVKKARTAISAGPGDEATAAIQQASSILDRAAKRGIIHRNAASRQKSRMMRHLNEAGSAAAAPEDAPKRPRARAAGTGKAKAAAKPRTKKS